MPDRYDPNSAANLDKFDNASDPSSDTWATLVTHITGYPVPDRSTIFDTLRSDHGGKLFRMDIKERSLSMLVKDSGFLTNKGEDYDIWFFDSGKKRSIMQARIVFEGRVKVGDEIIFDSPGSDDVRTAQVREGNEFTDYNKDKMSTIPLARYMNGPRAALIALLDGGTQNARFSNLGVPDADVVDLKSFNTTGESFDFAAKFFKDHAVVLKDWEDRFGRDDASWKGEAAEVFRSLLTKIRENYDSYVETFNSSPTAADDTTTTTGSTVYSRALSLGRTYLENAARELLNAWLTWAKSPYYDPHRVLRYVLDDLAQWVDTNNVAKTKLTSHTSRYSSSVTHSPQEGFSQAHPEYGDLTDIANWAKVGDKAVKIWSQGVAEYLGKPAATVQSTLNNHFLDLGDDFSENVPKPKSTSTASQEYEDRKREEQQEEINRQNEENRRYQDELRAEQNRQREEDRRYQDELRAEQNRQREEDRKYQDELRAEQERDQEEANRLQEDLRNEQNQQREEDRKYQDELREEQRREQEEAKREAEEQRKAVQESLGGLNDPNALNEQNLGNLDDLLNQNNNPATESNGDLGGTNNALDGVIDQNLGGLGNLNGGLGGSVKTPTGGRTQFDDGKLTTDFPDGSRTSFDPDSGVLTTTNPDGSTTTTDLGDGLKVTNPDGSVTSLGDDGKLTTTFPDGTVQTVDPATGQTVTTDPDGTTTTENLGSLGDLNGQNGSGNLGDLNDINSDLPTESTGDLGNLGDLNSGDQSGPETPTGGHTALDDGDFTTTFADGSKATFDPDTGLLTSTRPDGTTTVTDLTHGAKVTNPDGSTTVLDNGRLNTTFPDGSKQSLDPETGVVTVTDPQGRTETVDLHDLDPIGDLDTSDVLDGLNGTGGDGTTTRDLSLSELGLGGGAGSAASGGGFSGAGSLSGDGLGGTGNVAPLSDGLTDSAATPLAAAATPGAPGAPGMPGTPGMPMGGMGAGGMGAGGDKGNGERVRAVLVDAAEESERRNRRRRNAWHRQEDSDTFLSPAARVATTGGDAPEEEVEPGRRSTSSADYLEEDADVWGTEEGGTPAVIGR
ncbi:AAWKG family protein [Streptomyces heilongjiangensis]|uniref:AAWKG family protein n=1 Tax=Streptomyces heilongjiangensis TaxID=945052 RepID=A0ABW1B7E6_9ACTN|nr:AAWKG family protein [Streptomyces heilongjiangensis]MDC2952315.1 AAWKG family protein [Streptomyces heilongjiangensis]